MSSMKSNLRRKRALSHAKATQSLFIALMLTGTVTSGTAFGAGGDIIPVNQYPELQSSAENQDKVNKLEQEGEVLFKQKFYDRALIKFQEAYGMSKEMKFDEGEGRALTDMCKIYVERQQYPKAKYLGENATEVLANAQDKRDLGRARVALARAYFGLDNPDWAAQQLGDALKIFTQETSSSFPDAAELLVLSADLMIKAGKVKEALQFLDQAAAYYGQSGDQQSAVGVHIKLAGLMDALGLYVAAEEEADKAVGVARTMAQPQNRASLIAALSMLANTQYILCEYTSARATYEQVLPLMASMDLKSMDAASRANIDLGYGVAVAATGDIDQARVLLERSIAPMRKSGAVAAQAGALNALAVIEDQQGQPQKAIALVQQALDLQSLINPKQERLHVLLLQNIAAFNAHAGDYRQAKEHELSGLADSQKIQKRLAACPIAVGDG